LTPVEQWHAVWDILFPRKPRPTNPYLGSLIEEFIDIVRDFWKQEGPRIITNLLHHSSHTGGNGMLYGLLLDLLDEVRVQFGQRHVFPETMGPHRSDNHSSTHRRQSFPREGPHPRQITSSIASVELVETISAVPDTSFSPSTIPTWNHFNNFEPFATIERPNETQCPGDSHSQSGLILDNPGSNTDYFHVGAATAYRPGFYDSPSFPLAWEQFNHIAISQA
jgi:hypothetical protein